jgi:predicted PurR-regulated permease PerM
MSAHAAAPKAPRAQLVNVRLSWVTLLTIAALVAFAWAFVAVRTVLLVLFLSVFLAAVLDPPVERLAQRMGRGRAALTVVGSTVLALGVVALLALSPISDGVKTFANDAPKIVQEVRSAPIVKQIDQKSHAPNLAQNQIKTFVSGTGKALGGVFGVASGVFGATIALFSLVFMTLFLLMDLPKFRRAGASLLFPDARERVDRVTDEIVAMTSRYMLGNISISVICGFTYGLTAVILGVPYPVALAVIAGLLDLIPNVGSLIAGIIVALVSLTVSLPTALIFIAVVLIYQQVENYILQPTIVGKAADVPGYFVIASVLVFGGLFGVVGAILGVPIFAAGQIIVRELTAERRTRIAAADVATAG